MASIEHPEILLLSLAYQDFLDGTYSRLLSRLLFGLPWSYGDCHRTTFQLNPSGLLPDNVEPFSLPKPYSMKVLYVKYAPSEDKLYIPTEGAVRQSLVWAPTYGDRTQAAVVEARLGQGPIYYCGDVNGKDGSHELTLSLCGFKGECAPM